MTNATWLLQQSLTIANATAPVFAKLWRVKWWNALGVVQHLGILQMQKTWIESVAFNCECTAVLRCFRIGNTDSLPCCRQSWKCFLILFWSKTTLPGWTVTLLTNAIANAMANSPQFALPDCIWTSITLRSIVFCSVNKIAAICCFTIGVTELNKLSYTNISASRVAPIVLIVSQCLWPSCRICTSSPLSILNAHMQLAEARWLQTTNRRYLLLH